MSAEASKSVLNGVAAQTSGVGTVSQPSLAPPVIPPPGLRRRRAVLWLAVFIGVAVLTLTVWAVFAEREIKSEGRPVEGPRTVRMERRDFVRMLRLSGTTAAAKSYAVLAPQLAGAQLGSMVVTKLAPAGSKVKQGDLLVEFDRQSQTKNFLDKQAEYRDLVDQIAKKQAEEGAARAKDETDLKQAEDELKKAELEVQKNEILSRIDAEKNLEALDEAKANLKELRETFDLKRRAARAQIRILEIQRDRARGAMDFAQLNAGKMTVRSPMEGIVVLNTIWREGKWGEVKEGDQVQPGVPFMQVVNPSAMEVRVRANQADAPNLRQGMPAQVRLDAYPEMVFPARLEQLAPMAANGEFSEKVRTFLALFPIQGSDPKLMPDLSAAVDVELEHLSNVLVVPRESVVSGKAADYVRVKRGLGFEKRPVQLGPRNHLEVVVLSGLQAGDLIERNPT